MDSTGPFGGRVPVRHVGADFITSVTGRRPLPFPAGNVVGVDFAQSEAWPSLSW